MLRKSRHDLDYFTDLDDPKGKLKGNKSKKLYYKILCCIAIVVVLLFVYFIATARYENRDPRYTLSKKTKEYVIIDTNQDNGFMHILRNDKIVEIERYDAGLSEKYICVLESGYQVLIKPMEEWHYFSRVVPTWDASKLPKYINNKLGRFEII